MKSLFIVFVIALSSACQTSDSSLISNTVYNAEKKNPNYQELFKKFSHSTTVYSNYETLYFLNVTALAPDFRESLKSAMAERGMVLDQEIVSQDNLSFLASIYSPNNDFNDMTDSRFWNFVLKINDKEIPMSSIKKIKNKPTWHSFITYINQWSFDYVISFKIPPTVQLSGQKIDFVLANSEAKTLMTWE